MQLLVRFIGHIDERKRPENFPTTVEQHVWLNNVADLAGVHACINEMSAIISRNQHMVVEKDKKITAPQIGTPGWLERCDDRVMVPLHIITHIETMTVAIKEPEKPEDKAIIQ